MTWQGVSKYEYTRLFGILIKLTHPEDYNKFKLFILHESYSLYNINPVLFNELLWINDPEELKNRKFKLFTHKKYTSYREGKTCISLWYNVKNIAIYKLFHLMEERHYELFSMLKKQIKS